MGIIIQALFSPVPEISTRLPDSVRFVPGRADHTGSVEH